MASADAAAACMVNFAAAITAASVGETALCKIPETTFPDSQVPVAPCLCFDVALQKKCIVVKFVVTTLGGGYVDWAVYGLTVAEDGEVTKRRGLEHLQFVRALQVKEAPFNNEIEAREDLDARIK